MWDCSGVRRDGNGGQEDPIYMLPSPSHVAGRSSSLGRQGGNADPGLARKGTRGRVAAEPVASGACAAKRVRTVSEVGPSIMRSPAGAGLNPSFDHHHIASGGDCMGIHLEGSGEGLASLTENPSRASLEPAPDRITQGQARRSISADAPTPTPPDIPMQHDTPFFTPPHLDLTAPPLPAHSPPPPRQTAYHTSILS